MKNFLFENFDNIDNKITLDEAFDNFQRYNNAKNLSEDTIRYYNECFDKFTRFYHYSNLCSSLNKNIIIEYVTYLRTTNIKEISINTKLRGIRAFINYCILEGYTSKFDIVLFKIDKTIKNTYTDNELYRLLEKPNIKSCNFSTFRAWVIINYLFATGNRLRTVINIKIRSY